MTPPNEPKRTTGRFAYDGLERIFHERARLSILSSLAAHADGLLFNELKALCKLTDGNLSRQIQVLEESHLVEIWKGFAGKRPQTLCRLTEAGRRRFFDYIAVLENVVADAQAQSQARAESKTAAKLASKTTAKTLTKSPSLRGLSPI